MNKSYTPSEVISLFYNKLLLETIPQEELKERIQRFSDEISATPNIQESVQEANDKIKSNTALTEIEKNYAISRNKNYLDPNYMFDLVPLATVLNNSNYDKVIERKEDGTLIDLSTNEVINKENLKNSNGKYVIIERKDSGKTFFNFRIVEKGELFQTEFSFDPRGMDGNLYPVTSISKTYYAKFDPSSNNLYYYYGNTNDWSNMIDISKLNVDEKDINQIISVLYSLGIDEEISYEHTIPDEVNKISSKKMSTIYPEGNSAGYIIENNTILDIPVFNSMLRNKPNLAPYFASIKRSRILDNKGVSYFEPKLYDIDYNENSLGMDDIAHYNELSKIELAKHMQMNDAVNEISQNSKDNIQNKLQSEEFKEFQAKREEREQKQQELQEKIAVENQAKENWQNSPEHPENLRKAELSKFKQTIEVLDQLKKVNPTLLSKEQLEYLAKSQEFFEMYEKENNREHEVDTGMSEESRNWYQEHYTGMRR